MKIIWTPRAADDLEYAVHEISADRPDAAVHVASMINPDAGYDAAHGPDR